MTGDAEKLKETFVTHYKKLSMPLIVAENIIFQRVSLKVSTLIICSLIYTIASFFHRA